MLEFKLGQAGFSKQFFSDLHVSVEKLLKSKDKTKYYTVFEVETTYFFLTLGSLVMFTFPCTCARCYVATVKQGDSFNVAVS